MEDPILEALSFHLDSDLNVENTEANPAQKLTSSANLSSSILLGLNQNFQCIMPDCTFLGCSTNPQQPKITESDILEHLLCEHNFVIDQVDQIANFNKYVSYWREKFRGKDLLEYCVSVVMDRPLMIEKIKRDNPSSSKDETKTQSNDTKDNNQTSSSSTANDRQKFFMLTPLLPEDKILREKLWTQRLEIVLEVNRIEREQKDFSKQCLFCREVITGNRVNIFNHMVEAHSFHIGQADNMVFVNELLDFINTKLNSYECIYCGKIYKDKTTLREHMRKKGHKRVPDSDANYDKYYVINYLEPGKTWKSLQEEEQEDDRKEEEWTEKFEETSIVCLFCSHQNTSFDSITKHMLSAHNFDFKALTSKLSFYQKVKIVNFIRRFIHQNICLYCEKRMLNRPDLLTHLASHITEGTTDNQPFPSSDIWDRAEYFFPTYENDQFLIYLDRDNEDDPDQAQDSENVVIMEDLPEVQQNSFLKSEFPSR